MNNETISKAQADIARLVELMSEKDLIAPEAHLAVYEDKLNVSASYRKTKNNYDREYEFFRGDSYSGAMCKALAWVTNLPSAKEQKRQRALQAVAAATEALAEAALVDESLEAARASMEAMLKKLSENIIAHVGNHTASDEIPF